MHSVGRDLLGLFLAQQRGNSRSRVAGGDDSVDYDVPGCVNNLHNFAFCQSKLQRTSFDSS